MKSLKIGRYPEVVVEDLPVPAAGPGQVVMRVDAVTTCPQWDLHLKHDEPMFVGHKFQYPYTTGQPGHEASGVIHEVGDGVLGFAPGQRVSAWRDVGHHVPGCYAQYVLLDAQNVIAVPEHLSPQATAPVELAMCVAASVMMLKQMNVLAGKRVGITGLGPAGLIAAQMARAEGATEVIGFDTADNRCAYAVEKGIVNAAYSPDAVDDIFPARPRRAAIHTAIDCVGAKRSVEWTMDRTHDAVALFGVQREAYSFLPRHYHPPLRLCGYPGHSYEAAQYAVSLLEAGTLDLLPLITHELPLEEYVKGIDLLETQLAIKICFLPWA